MIRFFDAEIPTISMAVGEDFDVINAVRFHINDDGKHLFFVLSAHDRVRLIELLGGTDGR